MAITMLKKPIKKPKKVSISKLKAKADKLFSDFIRERDGFRCITCGKKCVDDKDKRYFHNGHYVPRYCMPLRYDERNCNCQCYTCNVSKKGNYPVYTLKMIAKHGDNILYELDEIWKESKRNIKSYGADYYEMIISLYSTISKRK